MEEMVEDIMDTIEYDEYELLALEKGIDIDELSEYSHEKTGAPR